ncbi:MAG: RCC1 domain-containing protein, partial [Ghiorsea sp.]
MKTLTKIIFGITLLFMATQTANAGLIYGKIAAGGHTVALKSDGTVVAWGRNSSGRTSIPAGLTGVVAV